MIADSREDELAFLEACGLDEAAERLREYRLAAIAQQPCPSDHQSFAVRPTPGAPEGDRVPLSQTSRPRGLMTAEAHGRRLVELPTLNPKGPR